MSKLSAAAHLKAHRIAFRVYGRHENLPNARLGFARLGAEAVGRDAQLAPDDDAQVAALRELHKRAFG